MIHLHIKVRICFTQHTFCLMEGNSLQLHVGAKNRKMNTTVYPTSNATCSDPVFQFPIRYSVFGVGGGNESQRLILPNKASRIFYVS